MADIDHNGLKRNITHQGTWGNKSCEHRKINSDPDNGDRLRFMVLPAGTTIMHSKLVHGAFGASVTCQVGIAPVDGSSADPDAIMASGQDIAAAGVKTMTTAPFTLTKDSYITLTTGGANAGGLTDADLVVDYVFNGQ